MSFFKTIFHRGPTIQQQHIDHWLQDRDAAMQTYYDRRSSGADFDDLFKEFGPMLRREQTMKEWEKIDESDRIKELRKALQPASRLTRLRQRRGLPFKSRRQP